MLIFTKKSTTQSKPNISLCISKDDRRVNRIKKKKNSKENKKFLQYLGFKLQNAANLRSTASRQLNREL